MSEFANIFQPASRDEVIKRISKNNYADARIEIIEYLVGTPYYEYRLLCYKWIQKVVTIQEFAHLLHKNKLVASFYLKMGSGKLWKEVI